MLPNDVARCAGGRWPFAQKKGAVLAICRDCARRHSFGDEHTPWMEPPFKHDGERYVCDYRIHAPDGAPDS